MRRTELDTTPLPSLATEKRALATKKSGELLVENVSSLWDGAHLHRDAAVLFSGGKVAWVGASGEAPPAEERFDARGLVGMPGLVDCHTHTVFAGSRVEDFTRRLAGESYSAILQAGGGIHSTVAATNGASEETLTAIARERFRAMAAGGVSTVEVKSGYGLCPEGEEKMLRAAVAAGEGLLRVIPTFLGAHAIPPGRERGDYLSEVIDAQLPRCAPLCEAIDVYCDVAAFTLDETRLILLEGRRLGLRLKVHAEQVGFTGAAKAAAEMGALSADHLERIDNDGIAAMAAAGTVAVLLPGAMVYLRDTPPPVAKLRAAGVKMAVGTDFNPGSSPLRDLLSAATLSCLAMGLTVEEALGGITARAGEALGHPELGRLAPGSVGDMVLFAPPPGEPADARVLVQYLGGHQISMRVRDGRLLPNTLHQG